MDLKNYPYRFFKEEDSLRALWEPTLNWLCGQKLKKAYGVWDKETGQFCRDLPFLLCFEAGVLAVHYRKGPAGGFALAWNGLLPADTPIWPPEKRQRYVFEEEEERQDLCWCCLPETEHLAGAVMECFALQEEEGRVNALHFTFEKGPLTLRAEGELKTEI